MRARKASLPPLFIVGAPRSGTSLVYRALALHPGAAWINNYQRRLPGMARLAGLNRLGAAAPGRRRVVWFGADGDNAYRYNAARSLIERLYPQPTEGEPVFEYCAVPEAWDKSPVTDRQRRLPDLLERTTAASGGQVLVSKRIGHNRRIALLHELIPDARFLDVTRDGRAVAYSLSKVDWWPEMTVWWYGGTPRDWAAAGRDPLELCARHWVEETAAISAGLETVPPAQVSRITYEALVAEPETVLGEAAAFAGLDPDDASWRRELAAIRFPNKNAAWSANLDPDQQAAMSVMDEQLTVMGYGR